ncbi:ANTAR domain-containing protein [Ideonella dechloratans]|uniref:ANTAR domain-containing protein n=1 Tax=Ideonella dechloratans TaxID=36863 RepID=UPI0035B3AACE
MSLLSLLCPDDRDRPALLPLLQAAGWAVWDAPRQRGAALPAAGAADAPLLTVLWGTTEAVLAAAAPQAAPDDGLEGLRLLCCPPPAAAQLPAWLALLETGQAAWLSPTVWSQPEALALSLSQAQAQARQRSQWRQAATRAQAQLDERKWVDRAKGVLMNARGISEDEAFRLLRGASMHAHLRLSELSRSVIEAAQWAEAVNRAGQLRMLSQRLVKLAAQRQAGVEVKRARAAQDEAAQRLQDNLAHLASLPLLDGQPAALREALTRAEQAWGALQRSLDGKAGLPLLAEADARAEELLQAAEALTAALEAGGARGALRIVNLCGRQRMRVQRLAKLALLAGLLNQPERLALLPALMDDFEATLRELEQAPLSTPDIRETLAAARDEWLRLLRALRGGPGIDVQGVLAASSDALLALFHRLTDSYERSLQLIMS